MGYCSDEAECEKRAKMTHEYEPDSIVFAGDWHGNVQWAQQIIGQLPELLPDEPNPLIVHVGDFGIWYGKHGDEFISRVTKALEAVNGELWFIEGNHECYPRLNKFAYEPLRVMADGKIKISNRIFWLTRNHRWVWHGKTWLGLGGAISVDRCYRSEGVSVFAEEALSSADLAKAAQDGPCDVLVAHDCPSMAPLPLGPLDPAWDVADIARAQAHRELLNELVTTHLQPELIVHGHYHLRQNWSGKYEFGTGKDVRVISLDMNGTQGNVVVCDLKNLYVS